MSYRQPNESMKTPLLFLALVTVQFTALAQTNTTPVASIRPEWIDPLRFRQYDANKDGKLDLQEQEAERQSRPADLAKRREQWQQTRKAFEERKRRADLERFDANQDGVLDATEEKARDLWYADRQKEHIQKYDKNGNGKIDPEEMRLVVPVKPAR